VDTGPSLKSAVFTEIPLGVHGNWRQDWRKRIQPDKTIRQLRGGTREFEYRNVALVLATTNLVQKEEKIVSSELIKASFLQRSVGFIVLEPAFPVVHVAMALSIRASRQSVVALSGPVVSARDCRWQEISTLFQLQRSFAILQTAKALQKSVPIYLSPLPQLHFDIFSRFSGWYDVPSILIS
jgi:hypothetical protein